MQTGWKAQLDPLVVAPANQSLILTGLVLTSGSNTINHKLGQKLQGWVVVGQNASATFYDAQSANTTPALTLVLIASAAVTINLEVF